MANESGIDCLWCPVVENRDEWAASVEVVVFTNVGKKDRPATTNPMAPTA
jgi:hypothetical protein